MMVTVNLLVTALPQRYFGKLADKHNKTTMMIIGNIIMAGTILLIPLTWNFYSLLVVNAVMGLGGAVAIPANTALAAQFGKIHGMGSVMGLLNAGFAIGMTIGPLIAGVIHDFIGINMVFIYTSAIVTLGTAVFYGFVKRNNQKVEVITT